MPRGRSFSRRGGWSSPIPTAYRSGLEESIAKQLEDAGVPVMFEQATLKYVIPESSHTYTPDFVLPNGVIVESKGIFDISDRKKHVLIKTQYPHLDIRFVFSNPQAKINKTSKTTYALWCEKHGFFFARKYIPFEWIKEESKDISGLQFKTKNKKGE